MSKYNLSRRRRRTLGRGPRTACRAVAERRRACPPKPRR